MSEHPTASYGVFTHVINNYTLRFGEENGTAVYWHCRVVVPCPNDSVKRTRPGSPPLTAKFSLPETVGNTTQGQLQQEGKAREQRSVPQVALIDADGHWDS